jgi:DNA-binding transcriptional LysR family regulator
MSVDLALLRVLVMVMEERNVTRASERLHQSQPSVSIALRRLREVFDDPLFLPLRRGVVPTPRAIDLAQKARRVLQDVEEMTRDARFDPATERASILIGANDYGVLSVIAPLQRCLRAQAPGLAIQVRRLASDISRQIERQEVDMAITILSEPSRFAHVRPLFRDTFAVAMAPEHPLAQRPLSLDDFCSFKHLRVTWADSNLVDPVDNQLSEMGRSRLSALEVPSYFHLPPILASSDLLAVAPAGMIAHFGTQIVSRPLPFALPGFSVNLVWDGRTDSSAPHQWLRAQILGLPSPGSAPVPA